MNRRKKKTSESKFLSKCTITFTNESMKERMIETQKATVTISQQIGLCVSVFASIWLMREREIEAKVVLEVLSCVGFVGSVLLRDDDFDRGVDRDDEKKERKMNRVMMDGKFPRFQRIGNRVLRRFKLGVGIVVAVAISSPLFLTMTASVSDDTAIALATVLMFAHLATHDYRVESSSFGNAMEGVSLVSAIFSSSLMASRLNKLVDAFACALLAVSAFTMSMPLRRQIRKDGMFLGDFLVTCVAHSVAVWLLRKVDHRFGMIYVSLISSFIVVVPVLFATTRRTCKMKIEGPWEEAKPELDLMKNQGGNRAAGVPIFRHMLANAPTSRVVE